MSGKEAEADGKSVDLIEKVQEYLFDSENFEATFMAWGKSNCDVIDLDSEEMKLEYTELHNKFIAFFEKKLEHVIEENGSDVRSFYRQVKEILLALFEFDVFMQMMRECKEMVIRESKK